MIIGIDLDDTITKTEEILFKYAKKYNEEKNIIYKIDRNKWDWNKAFGWNDKSVEGFFEKYLKKVFEEVEIKEDAKEVINTLKKDGDTIIIITARNSENVKDVHKICEKWLKDKQVKVDKIVINGGDKAKECKENNIDIFIDDRNISLRKCIQ